MIPVLPPLRVLVTGSRVWADPDVIASDLKDAARKAFQAKRRLVVVHGRCDPRRRIPGRAGVEVVPWDEALELSFEDQGELLGADWLAGWLCRAHGWEAEEHPADWAGPCRPECRHGPRRRRPDGMTYCQAAGMYRNLEMLNPPPHLGAAYIRNGSPGASQCAREAERAGIRVRRRAA